MSQGIGAETGAYDCAVVEVTGLYPMCGGRSKAQPQPARDPAPHAARRGQPAVEFRLVVDPRHEPGEQDEVGHGVQARSTWGILSLFRGWSAGAHK